MPVLALISGNNKTYIKRCDVGEYLCPKDGVVAGYEQNGPWDDIGIKLSPELKDGEVILFYIFVADPSPWKE